MTEESIKSPIEPTEPDPSKFEEGTIALNVGVDKVNQKVVLTLEITGARPLSVQIPYDLMETRELCLAMIEAGNELDQPKRSPIVIPPSGNTRIPLNGHGVRMPHSRGGPKPR